MYAEYKSRRLPVSWYLSSSPERDLADAATFTSARRDPGAVESKVCKSPAEFLTPDTWFSLHRCLLRIKTENTSNTLFTSSPFDGIKGQRWHQFVQAFKAGAAAEFLGEDDESIWDACTDVDTGGNGGGATPMPSAGAALAKAQRMRKKRQAKAYKLVYSCTNM